MCIAKARWMSFLDWLEANAMCTPPADLWQTLGPVWRLVPQARQAAEALGPWLVSLLEARQRARLAQRIAPEVTARDLEARPLTRAEAGQISAAWTAWRLEAELARLARLVETPGEHLSRFGWVEWEVRYWALVITLARIGCQYALLARQPGPAPAERLRACAETVWQQTTQAKEVLAA
jgi:hypothetical protein